LARTCGRLLRSFGAIQPSKGSNLDRPTRRLQFSKERLTDFGDLPRGEIPDSLMVSPASKVSSTDNGVTVGTEVYGSPLVTIGFHWKYGTRHETPETSGLIQFIHNLRLRGTQKFGRQEIEGQLQGLGAKIHQEVGRERNSLYITVQKENVSQAIETVADLLNNSTYSEGQLEAERESIYRRIIDLQKDMMEATIETAHFAAFRDHQMGQPSNGVRENIASITAEKIRDFVAKNNHGNNLVITATGNVDHAQILDLAGKSFGGLTRSTPALENLHMPMFTPSLTFMRDDEMTQLNAATVLRAPRYNHADAAMMKLLVEVIGEYRADKHTGINLNDPSRQYNFSHQIYGNYPDLTLVKPFYEGYSDVGLFGTYIMGSELYGAQVIFYPQVILTNYAVNVISA